MASIGEMVSRLTSSYNKGKKTGDSRLRPAHAYSILVSARLREIWKKREYERIRDLSDFLFQTIPCAEVIEAPASECECIPGKTCKLWRTRYQIPETIDSDTLHWVTDQAGTEFDPTTWTRYKDEQLLKYTGNLPRWFMRNRYVYTTQEPPGGIILINGIFRDPLEVANFPQKCITNDEDGETLPCVNSYDVTFAVDGDLESLIIRRALEELGVFFAALPDDKNNSRDDRQNPTA